MAPLGVVVRGADEFLENALGEDECINGGCLQTGSRNRNRMEVALDAARDAPLPTFLAGETRVDITDKWIKTFLAPLHTSDEVAVVRIPAKTTITMGEKIGFGGGGCK